jgi:hypothetical protein
MGKGPWLGGGAKLDALHQADQPAERTVIPISPATCSAGPSGSSPPLRAKRVGDLLGPIRHPLVTR